MTKGLPLERTQTIAFLSGGGEAGRLMRALDWEATPIGPPEGWPQVLQTLTALMLSSSQPMFVVWGEQRTTLYNDAYGEILAGKHPALGEPFDRIWHEIWDRDLKPIVTRAFAGEALHMSDIALVMTRKGYREETHFSFSYTPVRDAGGAVQGFFCPCLEITEQVLEERRARTRAELTERLRTSTDPTELAFEAAALLGRHFSAEQAAYVEIDATGENAVILRDWNDGTMASNAGRHRLEDFGSAFIADLKAGRSVAIGDVRDDPRTSSPEALASFASRGIRAVLNVPHLRAGRLAEGLAVHAREPRRWHPADVALAEEVADRMSAALERARAEAALFESEARFREFGDASVDALWVRDAETLAWEYLSAAFTTIYGIDRAEAVAETRGLGTLLDLIVPEDRDRTAQAICGLREGPGEYEYRIQRRSDGEVRWLRTTGFPLVEADGHARRLGGITRDVTEASRRRSACASSWPSSNTAPTTSSP